MRSGAGMGSIGVHYPNRFQISFVNEPKRHLNERKFLSGEGAYLPSGLPWLYLARCQRKDPRGVQTIVATYLHTVDRFLWCLLNHQFTPVGAIDGADYFANPPGFSKSLAKGILATKSDAKVYYMDASAHLTVPNGI